MPSAPSFLPQSIACQQADPFFINPGLLTLPQQSNTSPQPTLALPSMVLTIAASAPSLVHEQPAIVDSGFYGNGGDHFAIMQGPDSHCSFPISTTMLHPHKTMLRSNQYQSAFRLRPLNLAISPARTTMSSPPPSRPWSFQQLISKKTLQARKMRHPLPTHRIQGGAHQTSHRTRLPRLLELRMRPLKLKREICPGTCATAPNCVSLSKGQAPWRWF